MIAHIQKTSLYISCLLTCLVDFATDKLSYGGPSVEGSTASVVRISRLLAFDVRWKPVIHESISQLAQYIEKYNQYTIKGQTKKSLVLN